MNYPPITKVYSHVWSKYRPAVLKLMVNATDGPQEYKFSPHEFRSVNPKEKGGYGFTLQVFQGKAVNNIKASVVAQDLLSILKQSRKALELTEESTYEFVMDKQFVLHVTKLEKEPVVAEEIADPAIA
ncbi:MAG TPA: hypothetical protein VD816_18970 [Ohtaekwangia sp.]|nr:hypothetical protein [Ohtaekwangia sp.]